MPIGESESLILIFGCISYGLDSKLLWCDGERTGYYPVTSMMRYSIYLQCLEEQVMYSSNVFRYSSNLLKQ